MIRKIRAALVLTLLSLSAAVQAYPIFSGDATADFRNRPGSADSNPAGFYIWTNDSYDEWSVRWTGNDMGTVLRGDWDGRVSMSHLVEGSVQEFRFERRDGLFVMHDGWGDVQDYIFFTGRSGGGYDGFDFRVNTEYLNIVNFNLASTLFDIEPTNGGVTEGTGIYIGENLATPMVNIREHNGRLYQKFAIASVPEPGTLVLLGVGLLGLSAGRRLRK